MASNDDSDSRRGRRDWQQERRRSQSPRANRRPNISVPPRRREDGTRRDMGREPRHHRSRSAHRHSGYREDRDLRQSIQASRDRDANSPAIRPGGRPANASNRRGLSASVVSIPSIPYQPAPTVGTGSGQPDSGSRQHGREIPDPPRQGGPPREGNRPPQEESRPVTPPHSKQQRPPPKPSKGKQQRPSGNQQEPGPSRQSPQESKRAVGAFPQDRLAATITMAVTTALGAIYSSIQQNVPNLPAPTALTRNPTQTVGTQTTMEVGTQTEQRLSHSRESTPKPGPSRSRESTPPTPTRDEMDSPNPSSRSSSSSSASRRSSTASTISTKSSTISPKMALKGRGKNSK